MLGDFDEWRILTESGVNLAIGSVEVDEAERPESPTTARSALESSSTSTSSFSLSRSSAPDGGLVSSALPSLGFLASSGRLK